MPQRLWIAQFADFITAYYLILGAVTRFAVRNSNRPIDFPTSHCCFPLQDVLDRVVVLKVQIQAKLGFLEPMRTADENALVIARPLRLLLLENFAERCIAYISTTLIDL